jgi:hypothetical protein
VGFFFLADLKYVWNVNGGEMEKKNNIKKKLRRREIKEHKWH